MQAQDFQARLNHVLLITRNTLPTLMKNELVDTNNVTRAGRDIHIGGTDSAPMPARTHNLSHARSHQDVAYDSHGEEAFGKN